MKVSTRLYTGFGIFVFFVIIVCIFAVFQIQTLFKLTNTLHYYPSITHKAVRSINLNIMHMQTKIEKFAYFYDRTKLNRIKKELAIHEREVKQNISIIEKYFFGNKQNIDRVKKLFRDWKAITNEIIALYRKNAEETAYNKVFKGENAAHTAKLEKALAVLTEFADISSGLNLSQANSQTNNALLLAIMIVVGLFSGVWAMFLMYRKVAMDVSLSFDIADAMVKGDLEGKFQCDPNTESAKLLKILDKARNQFNERTQTIMKIEEHIDDLEGVKEKIEKNERLVELQGKKEKIQRHIAISTLKATKPTVFTGFFLEENAVGTNPEGYSTTIKPPSVNIQKTFLDIYKINKVEIGNFLFTIHFFPF
ncbi:MCP four helix bundle domain-containing protein [Thiotrichales bacterium HSG1]|nr:MCP four helix bundle domain-containing protein [Thiotrichales bacterium HSG1]